MEPSRSFQLNTGSGLEEAAEAWSGGSLTQSRPVNRAEGNKEAGNEGIVYLCSTQHYLGWLAVCELESSEESFMGKCH